MQLLNCCNITTEYSIIKEVDNRMILALSTLPVVNPPVCVRTTLLHHRFFSIVDDFISIFYIKHVKLHINCDWWIFPISVGFRAIFERQKLSKKKCKICSTNNK